VSLKSCTDTLPLESGIAKPGRPQVQMIYLVLPLCQKENAFAGRAAPEKASEMSDAPMSCVESGLGALVIPVP